MKTLEPNFTSKGFTFEQLDRDGSIALYRKRKPDWSPDRYSWEVIEIRESKAGQWGEITFEAKEVYPGDEQFGKTGFTFMSEHAARLAFARMVSVAASKAAGEGAGSGKPRGGP